MTTSTGTVEDGLLLRVLTTKELVSRLRDCTLGAALEVLAHDTLLKRKIAELEQGEM